MRTTVHLAGTYGVPMAIQGADGEWKEIGYVTDLEFTAEQDEYMPWGIERQYTIDIDLAGNEDAYRILMEIARALPVVDGKKEEE